MQEYSLCCLYFWNSHPIKHNLLCSEMLAEICNAWLPKKGSLCRSSRNLVNLTFQAKIQNVTSADCGYQPQYSRPVSLLWAACPHSCYSHWKNSLPFWKHQASLLRQVDTKEEVLPIESKFIGRGTREMEREFVARLNWEG